MKSLAEQFFAVDFESVDLSQEEDKPDAFKVPELPKNFHSRRSGARPAPKQAALQKILEKNSSPKQDTKRRPSASGMSSGDDGPAAPIQLPSLIKSKTLFPGHVLSNQANQWRNAYKTPQMVKDEDLSASLRIALSPSAEEALARAGEFPALRRNNTLMHKETPKSATARKQQVNQTPALDKLQGKADINDLFNQEALSSSLPSFQGFPTSIMNNLPMQRFPSASPLPFAQFNSLERASSLIQYGQKFQNFLNQNQELFFGQGQGGDESSMEPIKHIKHNQLDSILNQINQLSCQAAGSQRAAHTRHSPHCRPFVCKDMIHENLLKSIDEMDDAQILNFVREKYTQQ